MSQRRLVRRIAGRVIAQVVQEILLARRIERRSQERLVHGVDEELVALAQRLRAIEEVESDLFLAGLGRGQN